MDYKDFGYIMENAEESYRLEIKTNLAAVRSQAAWCGVKPGMRILDAGCGPGLVTSVLSELNQPGGSILGLDYSPDRIDYANKNYKLEAKVDFRIKDIRESLIEFGKFDLVWARFVLEYNRTESAAIVSNLSDCLKPGGTLCLLDLDYNCLSHYELPNGMEQILINLMSKLELEYNFDPYSGRKLYSYLFDLDYLNLEVDLVPHHLIYGEVRETDFYNWFKKVEVASAKAIHLFDTYPGGREGFYRDFKLFFTSRRRFSYTPLIIAKGTKPLDR